MRKIAVCIKQIPLIEDANFDPLTRTIRREGPTVSAPSICGRSRWRSSSSVVIAPRPWPSRWARRRPESALVEALAAGIDRAVHLEDHAFAGSDTLATARSLALWLKRERFDLILLGKYSLDAETGQVGPEIAELSGIAQITGVRKLEVDGAMLRAERESDEGFDEIECDLPALLTCAERVAQPIKVKPDAAEQAESQPIEVGRRRRA